MQDKYNIAKSMETQENSTANIKVTMIWALNKNKAKRKAKLKREFDKVEQREPRTILTGTNNRCSRMIPFAASPLINDYLTCNAKSELQC